MLAFFYPLLLLIFSCTNETPQPQSGYRSYGQPPVENVSSIIAGDEHACALLEDEEQIRCWGSNRDNQLELGSAKNSQITLDVSKARFSKISAGNNFTCGILKDAPHKGIPVCFGKDGGWFHTTPNDPIKDITASRNFACFIKNDDTIDCVGQKILTDNRHKWIEVNTLMKHGIEPSTGNENKDFSGKKFVNLKAGYNRICAKNLADGFVYCMGHNIFKSSQLPSIVLDYALKDSSSTASIDVNNQLNMVGLGMGLKPIKNINDPEILKYKKISSSFDLITSAGNHYDDGSIMPENTLIRSGGQAIEGVLDSVTYFNPSDTDKPERLCILKMNKKIVCARGNFGLFVFP